jgi:hypothetical protein
MTSAMLAMLLSISLQSSRSDKSTNDRYDSNSQSCGRITAVESLRSNHCLHLDYTASAALAQKGAQLDAYGNSGL